MIFCENDGNYIITAIGLLFWFKGMYRILDYYIPDSMTNNIILVILSLSIIYISAGSLRVLGSSRNPDEKNKYTNHPIAINKN
jgi:hypothetical protein